jgi:hypothetical protein
MYWLYLGPPPEIVLPANLTIPAGHDFAFLLYAVGTQNYKCIVNSVGSWILGMFFELFFAFSRCLEFPLIQLLQIKTDGPQASLFKTAQDLDNPVGVYYFQPVILPTSVWAIVLYFPSRITKLKFTILATGD